MFIRFTSAPGVRDGDLAVRAGVGGGREDGQAAGVGPAADVAHGRDQDHAAHRQAHQRRQPPRGLHQGSSKE